MVDITKDFDCILIPTFNFLIKYLFYFSKSVNKFKINCNRLCADFCYRKMKTKIKIGNFLHFTFRH